MKKQLLSLLMLLSCINVYAHKGVKWVEIGTGTFEQGFIFPYKVTLEIPYGVRDIEELKKGLLPLKFTLEWLSENLSEKQVKELFRTQLQNSFLSEENFRLSKNLINYFLKRLPATKRHDEWEFIYFPDEGTQLFIKDRKVHHLAGSDLNRALISSWLSDNPVLTSKLFHRLLKLQ